MLVQFFQGLKNFLQSGYKYLDISWKVSVLASHIGGRYLNWGIPVQNYPWLIAVTVLRGDISNFLLCFNPLKWVD